MSGRTKCQHTGVTASIGERLPYLNHAFDEVGLLLTIDNHELDHAHELLRFPPLAHPDVLIGVSSNEEVELRVGGEAAIATHSRSRTVCQAQVMNT